VRTWISPLERRTDFLRAFDFGGGGFAWHRNDFVTSPENKKARTRTSGLGNLKSYFVGTELVRLPVMALLEVLAALGVLVLLAAAASKAF